MDPVDPRERFAGAATGYARFRPSYPGALLDRVLAAAGVERGDRVADVGCGTGILTRLLAGRGFDVVGLDPNADMLAEAVAAGGSVEYLRGEAEATGLPGGSVALVTAAQAFHWFDAGRALAEFHRVLRPGGHVAALWNLRGRGPFMDAYDALLHHFSPEYSVTETWEQTLERLREHPRVRAPRDFEVPSAQVLDLEGLRGRAWSSSYVFRAVKDRQGFDEALRELFETHARGGRVEFPYRSVALVFRVGPAGASGGSA